MRTLFKIAVFIAFIYCVWYVWENYDLAGWYRHVKNAAKVKDTRQVFVLPNKKGTTFPEPNIISLNGVCEYSPPNIEIVRGEKVIWFNSTKNEQMIMGDDFDVKIIKPGTSFAKIFSEPKTFHYSCIEDEAKKGQIIVK